MNFVLIGKTLGRPDNDEDQEEMIQILKDISKKINACDKEIKNNLWKKQWPKDLDIILGDEKKGREQILADRINSSLSTKYYWRDWLTVVYSDMTGSNFHWRKYCGEGTISVNEIHWKKRYNILVASVPNTKKSDPFTGIVNGYKREKVPYRDHATWKYRYENKPYDAKKMYNDGMPEYAKSCKYPLAGCVIKKGTFVVKAPKNRLYHKEISNTKKIFHAFVLG